MSAEHDPVLSYIRRVLGMQPSVAAQLALREQQVEILTAEVDRLRREAAAEALREHDDRCESEYIAPPGGWTDCGCDARADRIATCCGDGPDGYCVGCPDDPHTPA